jgi:hypothetical protein
VDLHDALTQIAEIRRRAAAAGEFRGYRAVPVAAAGVWAFVAALFQSRVVADPVTKVWAYAGYWAAVAALAATPAAVRIYLRDWRDAHDHARELTRLAVAQFAPCLAAGALATVAIVRHSPDFGWALPGLWQTCFGLGVFASCRLLPRATVFAGVIFLAGGTFNLAYGRGDLAYSPWSMGLPFGAGHLLLAYVFYRNQERSRADETE